MSLIYCILLYFIFVINPVLSKYLPNISSNLTSNNGRIVGGRDVIEGEIPYIVSLQVGDSEHWCGGTILSRKTIITAAHCVDGADAFTFKIRYNSLHRFTGGTQVNITRIIVHHNYHSRSYENDIAIVHLASSLVLNQLQANSAQLPEEAQDPPEGVDVTVSGWGRLQFNGPLAVNLQAVNVSMISRQKCRQQFGESNISDNMICAGDQGDKDACQGDSGGPLVHDGVLWGITSWGPNGCAVINRAGVYTRVGQYVDWIRKYFID